ncbi:MAG: hypothetical protein RLZZ46_339 [Bacteroidota bacterium]
MKKSQTPMHNHNSAFNKLAVGPITFFWQKTMLLIFFQLVFLRFHGNVVIAQAPAEACLLWELSGNGLAQPSYIFGTIHLIPQKDFVVDKLTLESFDKCKTLALEADLNMDEDTRDKLALSTLLPDNRTLEDYMTKDDYKFTEKYVKDSLKISSIKWILFKRVRPFYLSALFMKEIAGKTESYEETFIDMAKKKKMTTMGLESILFQIGIIDSIPVEQQITMMLDGFREGKNIRKEWENLITVYKSRDLNAMQALMVDEGGNIPDFEERFLNRRNNKWIPGIEQQAAKEATFIAVGAAHLVGAKGIIALLREKGYTLKPVM